VEGTCAVPPTATIAQGSNASTTINVGDAVDLDVVLTGDSPWTITWGDDAIESDVQESPHRRRVLPSTTTIYEIATVQDRFGCTATGNGSMTVNVTPSSCTTLPDATFANFYATVHANSVGNEVSVRPAGAGATYSWLVDGAEIMSGQGTERITYDVRSCSGTVTVSVKVTNDCGTSTNTRIVKIAAPQANVWPNLQTVDPGTKVRLNATLKGVGPWFVVWSDSAQEIRYDETATSRENGGRDVFRDVTPQSTTEYRIVSIAAGPQRCRGTIENTVHKVNVNCPQPDATLTVSQAAMLTSAVGSASVSSPVAGATYKWSIDNGTIMTGAESNTSTSITFRTGCAAATGKTKITVTVTAPCGAPRTVEKEIVVTPLSASVSGAATINQGATATIQARMTGTPPWTLTWADGSVQNNVTGSADGTVTRVVSPTRTTTYTLSTVTDAFGCVATVSGSAKVTVIPPAPSAFVARPAASTSVLLEWAFGGTADQFEIERFIPGSGTVQGGSYESVATIDGGSARSYLHSGLPTGKAYVYRVRAVMSDGSRSDPSLPDLTIARLFTDDPLIPRKTEFAAVHVAELRAAVDAVRALAPAIGAGSYTTTADRGWPITWATIEDLRNALNGGRSTIGLPLASFTSRPSDGIIRGVYVSELRGNVQ
jgi:hypothetical protein